MRHASQRYNAINLKRQLIAVLRDTYRWGRYRHRRARRRRGVAAAASADSCYNISRSRCVITRMSNRRRNNIHVIDTQYSQIVAWIIRPAGNNKGCRCSRTAQRTAGNLYLRPSPTIKPISDPSAIIKVMNRPIRKFSSCIRSTIVEINGQYFGQRRCRWML